MEQRCPRCRLFNPPGSLRCDCGFDFATKTVQPSYVLKHVLQKHGGEAAVLARTARRNIRAGVALLAFSAAIAVFSFAAGNLGAGLLWPLVSGGLLLARGLRQRRQHHLDADLQRELTRRS